MPTKFIEVDLNEAEKEAILKYAEFVILDTETKEDLAKKYSGSSRRAAIPGRFVLQMREILLARNGYICRRIKA